MGSSKWREASVRDLRTHLRRHGRNTKLYLEKAEMVAEAERIDRLNKATAQWNAEDVEAWLVGLGADPALFQQYEIQGKDLQTLQEKEIRSMVTRSNTPEMVNKVVEEWKELKRRDDQASTPKNVQSHEKKGKKKALLFSGHGSKERDYSGAELDGYNETILPIDFKRAGTTV
eukprot:jgi/Pico_ML_1/53000/g3623.t1